MSQLIVTTWFSPLEHNLSWQCQLICIENKTLSEQIDGLLPAVYGTRFHLIQSY